MGKTYRDKVRHQDLKTHKKISREVFKEVDTRTRVKPNEKKERGGGSNWRHKFSLEEDGFTIMELLVSILGVAGFSVFCYFFYLVIRALQKYIVS